MFIVSKIDVLWSSRRTREFINHSLWTSYKIFLSLKHLFHFFSDQLLNAIFTRVLLRLTLYYYHIMYVSEVLIRRCSVKMVFLEISQNSQENTCARVSFLKKILWHRCFPVNFSKFIRTPFLRDHLRWLLLAFYCESTLYSFRTSSSKQVQYLTFKWMVTSWKYSRSNIVQTSSLCYVTGF